MNWKLRICLSNRIRAGAVTEENSSAALPSWLCIYKSKSWARTWQNEPWCVAVTHGIPPFPDYCYLEIPENVIKFNKTHSTIFVRIIEIFLFKSILIMDDEKIGPYSLKTPTLNCWKRSAMLQQKIEGFVSDWLIFRDQSINISRHSIFLYLRITRKKGNSSSFTQVLIIKQKLQETFHELSPGSEQRKIWLSGKYLFKY